MHGSRWRREETRPVGPARAAQPRRLSPTLPVSPGRGSAELFTSHNEPSALPKSLLDFLFNPFDLDQNGTVVSFGFPKQDFLWRMASPVAWNCRVH